MEKFIMQKWMEYSSDLHFVAGQITRDGKLLFIETELTELDFFERPVPKSNWTVRIMDGDKIETIELKNVPLIPTEIDLFTDGTLLIVQGRCLKDGNFIERNARRYNPNGQLMEAFALGDGISKVQIDESNTIWVSYFDEGIFGNCGWDEPMGSSGLVAYSSSGEKLWGADEYGICDTYALNVQSSKEVYFYYYDDFYLVKLADRVEESRHRIEGENTLDQFIVAEEELIAQVDINTLMRYQKRKYTYKPKEKLILLDEKGQRILGDIFMRGRYIYAIGKNAIYRREF
ncbi:hypothetical protein [Sutcliffiella rhizosphaerae]|uniref:Uncharacterized protein n=1 Tax=Sutcliffiella rhizosphaerae TaxID=2880967 RepID=A0ABM8YP72_9BACI|nr:hypothetical protein [Sutcliffiella rhizosphaerae]CAG9621542.1 hypothetical protein BACCIP111883_02315 [Sutcliffiella rhizosphaerae]